ncbi:MAG: UDP-N-acetylmuramoyl-tripeptide--D-alanyl-D-alanine ligase, partial [Candidatus Parcubacteria bacterium]|nr:UDP-N-acetylmuramoyl-tripeptide--D-alanyl-D-alanine ligase [Candidatus Parcubacteria bacterium]
MINQLVLIIPLILLISWFLVFNKKILFWIWLWQLKEYHIGRFLAHFSTEKGRKLIFNPILALKVSLLIYFLLILHFFQSDEQYFSITLMLIIALVYILYFIEGIKVLADIYRRQLKIPVLTKKTFLIIAIVVLSEVLILAFILGYPFMFFLAADIFSLLIATLCVGIVQPFSNLWRKKIIKKATEKRAQFGNLIVIGITGSYGKTSVKEILAHVLSSKFRVLKTKEHQNSEVGVSQCILNELKPEHEIFVAEMGAYNKGGIKLLSGIINPKIGIITGINGQHMATYGSQENIIRTKFELIDALPENGIAVFNRDSRLVVVNAKPQNMKSIFCSSKEKVDFWAEEVNIKTDSVSFIAFSKDGDSAPFRTDLLGSQNIVNILMAAAAAKELGMNLKEISQACSSIKPEQGAIQLKKGINGLNVIDSTYSANPEGVIADLDYLRI